MIRVHVKTKESLVSCQAESDDHPAWIQELLVKEWNP